MTGRATFGSSLCAFGIALWALTASPVGQGAPDKAAAPARSAPTEAERPEVPPPPFSDGIFPCSACHADLPVNRTRRQLTDMHDDILLQHDTEHRWCLD